MAQSALQHVTQGSFPSMCPVEDALTKLAQAGIEERGAIFTKREVVEFILDLVNYTSDRPLHFDDGEDSRLYIELQEKEKTCE